MDGPPNIVQTLGGAAHTRVQMGDPQIIGQILGEAAHTLTRMAQVLTTGQTLGAVALITTLMEVTRNIVKTLMDVAEAVIQHFPALALVVHRPQPILSKASLV
jgi:hypothetical protein